MSAVTLYGLCGAALVGVGLYGLIIHPQPLRKIVSFNLVGGGVFLLFGVVARRGATAGFSGDPPAAANAADSLETASRQLATPARDGSNATVEASRSLQPSPGSSATVAHCRPRSIGLPGIGA